MRILWITQIRSVDAAGGHVSTQVNMTRELRRLGNDTRLVLGDRPARSGGSAAEYWPCSTLAEKLLHQVRTGLAILKSGADVVLLDQEFQVHTACLVRKCLKRTKLPVVIMDVRTLPVFDKRGVAGRLRWLRFRSAVRCASRYLDGVTTISPQMSRLLRSTGDLAADALLGEWSSGSAVSVDHIQSCDDGLVARIQALPRPRGAYLGVLGANRGLEKMVDCVAEPGFKGSLVLIGDGPLAPELHIRALATGGDRVILVGQLPQGRALALLSLCDYGVCPLPDRLAWNVSSPLKVLEYVAAGLPVAVTDIPAHREILGRYPGAAFAAGHDSRAIANACTRAATLKVLPEHRAAVMQRYSWPAVAQTLLGLLKKAQKVEG